MKKIKFGIENGEPEPRLPPAAVAFATTLLLAFAFCDRRPAVEWRTAPVEKGDVSVEVTASGTVNPHSLVQVGTQVSGTIARIFADFNGSVKKGQLIALLDTTFLYAAVADAAATLRKAQAQESLAAGTARRTKELFDKGLAAQADLDQAAADHAAAQAALSSARAQLDRAKINLEYAHIRSPITGIVVNRSVDVGQTVAASFNTPTLFTIADDLTRMQVQAGIDEADIGQVKNGQTARFTVDAYPDRAFAGAVTQIRLQPSTVQNVVSYTVMIDVDNPDRLLMPGMTATITITIKQERGVLKVPAAALSFLPDGMRSGKDGRGGRIAHDGSRRPAPDSARIRSGAVVQGGERGDAASFHGGSGDKARRRNGGRIFVLENGKPVPVRVGVGLTNGACTEIGGDIREGQAVIIGIVPKPGASSRQQSPFGIQRPPGGGMGRMR